MAHLARILATLAFLLLMFAGLGHVVAHLAGPAGASIVAAASWQNILNGRLSGVVDRSVIAALPSTPQLDSIASGLSYMVLDDAGPQVRSGCSGWLFLAEELAETPHGDKHIATHARLARKIRDILATHGVELLVLPIRDKADLAHEQLCGLPVSAQAAGRLEIWNRQSRELGLNSIAMGKGWPSPGFLRTDTHWNAEGARHTAQLVAHAISDRLGPGATGVSLTSSPPEPRPGDLMRLAGLSKSWTWSGPEPDHVATISAHIARTGSLLDDVPAPSVILAGSSFSLRSGFIDFLQNASRREVAQKSRDGSGFAGALLDVLMNQPEALKQTRLVVWEFPLRTLTQAPTEAERTFLGEDT
ncbi:alginate O-acetyltransferase AlgX-related protein [Xanthobacter sp. TB0139]|uniref:alginate O-acetyltransferase AlgX-related protein n=1 Tax=Xanthobacter sp. TB0139 TaxID=3459178 RepID=UPI0040399B09